MPRVGRKRSDRRYEVNGEVWASEFEYRVCTALAEALGSDRVRRCSTGEGDTFSYATPVRNGTCLECGSAEVKQHRTYTPDICVYAAQEDKCGRTFVETKGYFSQQKRQLLRSFVKERGDVSLVLIFQSNRKPKGLKRTPVEWATSFLKCPAFVWDPKKQPEIPADILAFFGGKDI